MLLVSMLLMFDGDAAAAAADDVCVCSCQIVLIYVRFSPNSICNYVCKVMYAYASVLGIFGEFLWAVLSL